MISSSIGLTIIGTIGGCKTKFWPSIMDKSHLVQPRRLTMSPHRELKFSISLQHEPVQVYLKLPNTSNRIKARELVLKRQALISMQILPLLHAISWTDLDPCSRPSLLQHVKFEPSLLQHVKSNISLRPIIMSSIIRNIFQSKDINHV